MANKSIELAEIAEKKFRPLKKSLQKSFKKIRFSLQNNTLPDPKIIEQFIMEVEIMISYPGFGDDFYEIFQQKCLDLQRYHKKRELSKCIDLFTEIKQLRQSCHEKFRL